MVTVRLSLLSYLVEIYNLFFLLLFLLDPGWNKKIRIWEKPGSAKLPEIIFFLSYFLIKKNFFFWKSGIRNPGYIADHFTFKWNFKKIQN